MSDSNENEDRYFMSDSLCCIENRSRGLGWMSVRLLILKGMSIKLQPSIVVEEFFICSRIAHSLWWFTTFHDGLLFAVTCNYRTLMIHSALTGRGSWTILCKILEMLENFTDSVTNCYKVCFTPKPEDEFFFMMFPSLIDIPWYSKT